MRADKPACIVEAHAVVRGRLWDGSLVAPARFERTTCPLGGDRSIQLSYGVKRQAPRLQASAAASQYFSPGGNPSANRQVPISSLQDVVLKGLAQRPLPDPPDAIGQHFNANRRKRGGEDQLHSPAIFRQTLIKRLQPPSYNFRGLLRAATSARRQRPSYRTAHRPCGRQNHNRSNIPMEGRKQQQ